MAGPSGLQAGPNVGDLSGQQQHNGANITTTPRAGMQVMSATPNGIMVTMTPEIWMQLYGAGLVTVQQPGVLPPQQVVQQQPGVLPPQQVVQQQPGMLPPTVQEQQEMLRRFFDARHQDQDQEMPSASMVGVPPSMPKAARAPAQGLAPRDPRPQAQAARDPRGPWSVTSRGRSASTAESGIILTEIRADYDLSDYPFNSAVTFYIYTYVEVNGVRRLLRVRTVPE